MGIESGRAGVRAPGESGQTMDESGQMTVELAVVFPVMIVVAVITVNALLFFSQCAAFDRVARESVRIYATAPAHGEDASACEGKVRETLERQFDEEYLAVGVTSEEAGLDLRRYTAELTFSPTLFGRGLRDEVFGVALPHLTHRAVYLVDTYKPGVVV
jgi:Flp pilus assembly protein TadG